VDDVPPQPPERPVRYVLESDMGLLVNITEEHGEHLLIWSNRAAVERMVPAFVGASGYQVIEIEAAELRNELQSMREDGMRYVLFDSQPDAAGQMLPIDEARSVYENLARPNGEQEASEDHFLQRLDRARKTGQSLDPDADQIPIDCPRCMAYITLPEREYRAWRGGRVEAVRCPRCQAWFREAEFGRVCCDDCGKESGEMPRSLSRGMSRGEHPWRCMDCGDAEVRRLAVAKAKKKGALSDVNFYSVFVGSAALLALLAGLYVKFVLMVE